MRVAVTATLWYGTTEALPEKLKLEIEEPADNPYGEKIVDGVHILMMYVYDRIVGAGAIFVHNNWGDTTTVTLTELLEEFAKAKNAVDKLFAEYGVELPMSINLSADSY